MGLNLSVVIPVFKAREWVADCLNSLDRQTYSKELFEAILIFNGPDDGTLEYVEEFKVLHPSLDIVTLSSDVASATIARNEGAKVARGEHLTWLDIDDWISPEYLELLALSIGDAVVPMAQIVNVHLDGRKEILNAINNELFGKESSRLRPSEFVRAMTFMTAKLLPTEWVRKHPLGQELRSGEDVAFYGELMAEKTFLLDLMPAASGAVYYRRITSNSVSRGNSSRDFLVTQRAEVIRSLGNSCQLASVEIRKSLEQMMRSQASFIMRYIRENAEDYTSVIDQLIAMKIPSFPWASLQENPKKLVIAYNFAPFSDTGAAVASKRIRSGAESVDVISNDMSNVRSTNEENSLLSSPYVRWHHEVKSNAYFASESGIESFIGSGLEVVKKWKGRGRTYESLYSRSMWPASHFLAAAIKIDDPKIAWTAEFSDPARVTTTGSFRSSPISRQSFKDYFLHRGPTIYTSILEENPEVFNWSELLPYMFADRLIFTNQNQLTTMLGYAPSKLIDTILAKSVIAPQPTLPRSYYELESSVYSFPENRVNIAYFGEFYNTRGLGEVIEALELLSDEELQNISLSIFSSDLSPIRSTLPDRLQRNILLNPKVNYFKFLNLLDQFDCLIVNDAFTADHHNLNPYLPSKLSDYLGSTSKIWGITEKGSIMSTERLDYQSEIGSAIDAKRCLGEIIRDNIGGDLSSEGVTIDSGN
ncbi:glycosyltransferase [Paeniglutamicibacter terrestris]|uniref:Glycosyltransferase n=1 Tax=Paeniglutamicibacter terrestris TaxID=2723403 RepID=A0ABX1G4R6_9MICC|nr:glycosyltransferase [Paeniglutamicibacter terrestris]NKG20591.1 glycosyltransferase [Paeniglutamicibacter terrestris]